jgi:MFS superfamily sulfate permease-like transporter
MAFIDFFKRQASTRGRGNRECLAQGSANLVTGFLSGMGGCAMIGQSIINVSSGGRRRLSGVVAALCLILFILVGSPLISRMPMAPLVGLMFMVAIGTFEWASLKIIRKVPTTDVVVMCLVTGVTVVFHNLAVAVIIGVVISALAFAWESAKRIRARKYLDADGVKHYEFYGPLFFGSVGLFQEKFDVRNDPAEIVIDFKESRIVDHSAIEAINKVTERYSRAGKKLHFDLASAPRPAKVFHDLPRNLFFIESLRVEFAFSSSGAFGPFKHLFLFGILGVGDGFKELLISGNTPDIFRWAGIFAFQAGNADFKSFRDEFHGFKRNLVLP